MHSVAGVLDTGPASLYAHVVNKADIDELVIGRLCAQLVLPEPDPATWSGADPRRRAQIRDQYLKPRRLPRRAGPGPHQPRRAAGQRRIPRRSFSPGVSNRGRAAWAMDALSLYVAVYALETSLVAQRQNHQDDA